MTHFVTDRCIRCKYTDCVEVCPVDCFYEGNNMLVIDPDQCIDCGVCVPECPADAIVSDEFIEDVLASDDSALNDEQKMLKTFYKINEDFSKKWKNITSAQPHLEDADTYKSMAGKYQFFDENLKEE
ncbi:ferredoxin family protein [Anaplasma phagocytophilum]|uniref:Ferredoxin n=5 Tax=Anaplasma phagocytophilum TaxID=948 RepID=A0AA45UU44_ANAPH|nr:ferredoxin family protein [Anaplasma phagocytophilum]ABD43451.1 ferredoxin [Anaplasma phagocytophilum str. HZ]AGR78555.1 ferredoxin [Anaplasma phagocytophilum str. HZ2]AGR79802.1 ferredoxin [Anaplasma phagocytophilum str. JM]AGR81058.1 ferredoxin [Anaplasma phagocytophilum str. Dog2]KDB56424.1 ferredoxin [Anaplasma phagocytophilum str. MRK]